MHNVNLSYMNFMILNWSLRLEHAGCLAGLQHCSVRRVSPSGDLNLNPGGLRVPARVRQSYHRFVEGLGLELVANLLQSCVRSGSTV